MVPGSKIRQAKVESANLIPKTKVMSQGATAKSAEAEQNNQSREERKALAITGRARSGGRFDPDARVTMAEACGRNPREVDTVTATTYRPNCCGATKIERISWSTR
jgi:hypothetical protein